MFNDEVPYLVFLINSKSTNLRLSLGTIDFNAPKIHNLDYKKYLETLKSASMGVNKIPGHGRDCREIKGFPLIFFLLYLGFILHFSSTIHLKLEEL